MIHEKNVWPEHVGPLKAKRKGFELRREESGEPEYKVGDWLHLREFEPASRTNPRMRGGTYGQVHVFTRITSVLRLSEAPQMLAHLQDFFRKNETEPLEFLSQWVILSLGEVHHADNDNLAAKLLDTLRAVEGTK